MSFKINSLSDWKEMEEVSKGGSINHAGNSIEYKTGSWRIRKPEFLKDKCIQCGMCFGVCPEDAIPVNGDYIRTDFNYDRCKGCGVCSKVCPVKAIIMVNNNE